MARSQSFLGSFEDRDTERTSLNGGVVSKGFHPGSEDVSEKTSIALKSLHASDWTADRGSKEHQVVRMKWFPATLSGTDSAIIRKHNREMILDFR
jgi:hypothetical protein